MELKCPYNIEKCVTIELTSTKIAGNNFFMEIGADGGLHLQYDHYYAQVQGEIGILGVEWCSIATMQL